MTIADTMTSSSAAVLPPAAGLRLCGITGNVFRERREPLTGWNPEHTRETLRAYGRESELGEFLARKGNSFIAMSEDLLRRCGEPEPDADAIFLAYQTPDLFYPDVAGCYLTQRFTGSPVPLSVAEQGPGAAFTALRIADGMCRLGELRRAALFAYDQNAELWEVGHEASDLPDSAVLLLLGARGSVRVQELASRQSTDPADDLAQFLAARPEPRVLAGRTLLTRLGALAGQRRVLHAAGEHVFTSAWMSLAGLWPLTGPVLVADYHAFTSRLYTCLLVPEPGT